MATPYLAPSLARFRTSINTRWPGRDHSSDGWIGDAAHQSRTSDHNPAASGVVRALDIDRDGVHIPTLIAAAILHPSTRYVIYYHRIYHVDSQFKPKRYLGTNGHTGHVHTSIEHTKAAEADKTDWRPVSSAFTWPVMRMGAQGASVRQLQAFLNGHGAVLGLDGVFGAGTHSAVLAFQRKWTPDDVDGIVGPRTVAALRTR